MDIPEVSVHYISEFLSLMTDRQISCVTFEQEWLDNRLKPHRQERAL
jgi:hypothetical protein